MLVFAGSKPSAFTIAGSAGDMMNERLQRFSLLIKLFDSRMSDGEMIMGWIHDTARPSLHETYLWPMVRLCDVNIGLLNVSLLRRKSHIFHHCTFGNHRERKKSEANSSNAIIY